MCESRRDVKIFSRGELQYAPTKDSPLSIHLCLAVNKKAWLCRDASISVSTLNGVFFL
jgi:hypothetical protein